MHAGGAARGPTGKLGELVRAKDFLQDSAPARLCQKATNRENGLERGSSASSRLTALAAAKAARVGLGGFVVLETRQHRTIGQGSMKVGDFKSEVPIHSAAHEH